MIGDKITDIEAGKLAGIKNNLLLTNNMTKSNKFYISRSIKTIQSLSNAKDFIK
jgi:histidinol phosphatase-like enzyme